MSYVDLSCKENVPIRPHPILFIPYILFHDVRLKLYPRFRSKQILNQVRYWNKIKGDRRRRSFHRDSFSVHICICYTNGKFRLNICSESSHHPGFTCLVWQKLEEQNPSFFYTYNFLLRLKDQILAFNYLVRHQNSAEERYQQEKAVEGDSKTVDLGVLLSPTVVKNPLEKAWDADAPKG